MSTGNRKRRGRAALGAALARLGTVIPPWGRCRYPHKEFLEEARSILCMAEPEEQLTTLGADCPSPVSAQPQPMCSLGMPVDQQWPQGCQEATTTFTMGGGGGSRCFTPQVPGAPVQNRLSIPTQGCSHAEAPRPLLLGEHIFQLCHHDLAAAFSTWLRPPGTSWRSPGCQPEQGRQGPAAGRISWFLPMLHCCSHLERLGKRRHSPLLGGEGISLPLCQACSRRTTGDGTERPKHPLPAVLCNSASWLAAAQSQSIHPREEHSSGVQQPRTQDCPPLSTMCSPTQHQPWQKH